MLGPMSIGALSSGAAGPSSLLTGLAAYWKMDEESGTRVDSVGSNDLADNNTVTFGTGKQGNAAEFEHLNTEYLSRASNSDLQTGDVSFTFAAWVKLQFKVGGAIVAKDGKPAGQREYLFSYNLTLDRFRMEVFKATDSAIGLAADTFGPPGTGVFYLVVAWHDADADTLNIQVNNGVVDSMATGSALQAASDAEFRIGARVYDNSPIPFDGLIDEVGIWKRVLTADERSALYNGGDGVTYPFDAAPANGGEPDAPTLEGMEADEFMIAFIPDTQWYTWGGTAEFTDMTEWIATHADDFNKNIQMVLHEGDVIYSVQGNLSAQFTRADTAIDNLDAANVPYLLCMGNHDYDDDPPLAARNHVNFDGTFPQSRFTGQTGWVGGFYQATTFDGNAYCKRTIGGNDYLFMAISFGPTQDVLDWALGIIDANPTYDVWIVTHAYMYRDGTRLGDGDEHNPHGIFPGGTDTHDGEEMWAELKVKANIVWIQNGHDGISAPDGWVQARRQDNGDGGNLVNQVVANYHTTTHGGMGYMRLVAVRPTANRVDVYTYSPNIDDWFRDDANEFSVDYKNVP